MACRQFDPVCKEGNPPWQKLPDPATPPGQPSPVRDGDVEGRCSGDWTDGILVDRVKIPDGLAAGDYVLGWRWYV